MAPIYFPLLLNGLSYQPLGSLRFENYTKSVVRAADFQMNPLRRVQFSPSNHIILILELTPRTHTHTHHILYMVGMNIRSIQISDRMLHITGVLYIDWVLSRDEIRAYEHEHEFLWR